MTNYLQTKNKRRRPFGMAVVKPAGRRSETASLELFRQDFCLYEDADLLPVFSVC